MKKLIQILQMFIRNPFDIMHPIYRIKNFKKLPIKLTTHAKQRILQRYRLKLFSYEKDNPLIFVKKDIQNYGEVNYADFMSPFEMNKLASRHGKNSFVINAKEISYQCFYDETSNSIVVKTILVKK